MHTIYVMAHYYPLWAIPAAMGMVQFALHFRRRENRAQYYFLFFALCFVVSSVAWFYYRGHVHSQSWVKWVLDSSD